MTRFKFSRKAGVLLVLIGWCLSPSPCRSCSSFVVENRGHAIFGTNYDNTIAPGLLFVNKRGLKKATWSSDIGGGPFRWAARYASVTFTVGGYQHAWAGMNERGLVLSTMALGATELPQPDQRPSLDWGPLWMQYILDTCATIEDVMAADDLVRIAHTVDHYLVTDRSGNAMVVELLEGEMVTHSGGELPVAALTNTSYQDSINTWFANRDQGDYSGLSNSERRFCLVADRVASFQPTNSVAAVTAAFDTLELVAGDITQWSIVFDTGRLRAYFFTQSHLEIRYVDLTQLELRCARPSLMLDIHEPLSGDLSAHLFDLSYDTCYEHTEQYLITTGELDDETAAGLPLWIEQITSFPCERIRRGARRLGFVAQ